MATRLPPDKATRMRATYEAGERTLDEIALTEGVHPTTVSRYARRYGWQRRDAKAPRVRLPQQAALAGQPCPGLGACPYRPLLAGRLYEALEARIGRLAADADDAAATERLSRDLAALTLTLHRLVDLDRALEARATERTSETPIDARAARDELARRLLRFAEQEKQGQVPEDGGDGPGRDHLAP